MARLWRIAEVFSTMLVVAAALQSGRGPAELGRKLFAGFGIEKETKAAKAVTVKGGPKPMERSVPLTLVVASSYFLVIHP